MNNEKRLDHRLNSIEQRENAMKVIHIGHEILQNSTQERRDSKTIVLIRNKKQ